MDSGFEATAQLGPIDLRRGIIRATVGFGKRIEVLRRLEKPSLTTEKVPALLRLDLIYFHAKGSLKHAGVDRDRLLGDQPAVVGGEEQREIRDVLRRN